MTFGIYDPLHPKKWLNAAIVAYFLKRNYSSTFEPLNLRTNQDSQKKKKDFVKAQAKRKVVFAEIYAEEIEEDVPLTKVFTKTSTPSSNQDVQKNNKALVKAQAKRKVAFA